MPCYHPIDAFQCADGTVVFREAQRFNVVRSLTLPCGRCFGCRLERSRQWAVRCMHEAKLHQDNCFVTLTYSEENLPDGGSLNYVHFQNFMKYLRRDFGPVRFYMCGEYGEQFSRPHFHACLFGLRFPDLTIWKKTSAGSIIYRSKLLEGLWTKGHSSVGELTFESAAYTARYVMKKMTGPNADDYYRRVDPETGEIVQLTPEFTRMSLKPGIGFGWLDKYVSDVYPHDFCVVNGKEAKPPRYYDKKFADWHPEEFEQIQFRRESDARLRAWDNTDERLAVRETVAKAARASFSRKLT